MIARAALLRRWCTWSGRVWTGATTIESPVWTPRGSTFSIEQTAMHVSSASRMTSYSISCHPTRHCSTMTWPIGLARRPERTRSRYWISVSTMPPPVPPRVKAGTDDRRQPDIRQGGVGRCRSFRRGDALDDVRRRIGLADPVEQIAERLAILGHLDGPQWRAEKADPVPLQDAGLRQLHRQVQAGLSAEAGEQTLRPLDGDDRLDRLDRERLQVHGIGHVRVGHDRGRVRVHEDRAHTLGPKCPAGLGPGIVEFSGLADDDGTGSDDQDGGGSAVGRRVRWPGVGGAGGGHGQSTLLVGLSGPEPGLSGPGSKAVPPAYHPRRPARRNRPSRAWSTERRPGRASQRAWRVRSRGRRPARS